LDRLGLDRSESDGSEDPIWVDERDDRLITTLGPNRAERPRIGRVETHDSDADRFIDWRDHRPIRGRYQDEVIGQRDGSTGKAQNGPGVGDGHDRPVDVHMAKEVTGGPTRAVDCDGRKDLVDMIDGDSAGPVADANEHNLMLDSPVRLNGGARVSTSSNGW
jgi:hypothetical protein